MIKIRFVILFLALSSVLFSACAIYKPVEVGDIEKIKMGQITGQAINFSILVPVNNPNNYKFEIVKSKLEISLNKKPLTNVITGKHILIPKKFDGIIEFPVSIEIENIFSKSTIALLELFKSKEPVLKIDGFVVGKAGFLRKRIRINEKKKVSIF